MAYTGYTWTPMCSMTAMKYQKYVYVEEKPLLPGERRRACKDMERNMKGYKELRQELAMVRKTLEQQGKTKHEMEKTIQTSYYKSPVGTRTTKAGGMFFSEPVGRLGFFSDCT
eukprot:GFUD01023606.1.p1 GENE.GFUD01023606.1~~GFUD01023606.1.p1  ORF type:complete len:113 (+),score=42.98 GFUD01023606.1:89-427(+)